MTGIPLLETWLVPDYCVGDGLLTWLAALHPDNKLTTAFIQPMQDCHIHPRHTHNARCGCQVFLNHIPTISHDFYSQYTPAVAWNICYIISVNYRVNRKSFSSEFEFNSGQRIIRCTGCSVKLYWSVNNFLFNSDNYLFTTCSHNHARVWRQTPKLELAVGKS